MSSPGLFRDSEELVASEELVGLDLPAGPCRFPQVREWAVPSSGEGRVAPRHASGHHEASSRGAAYVRFTAAPVRLLGYVP